jgi:hypothetical protein
MSKAIYGHLAGSDAVLLAEVTRLRRRVLELEEQVSAYEADLVGSPARIVSLREAEIDAALRELGTGEPALT